MQTTTYSLDRHNDEGELIETIQLDLEGTVVIDHGDRITPPGHEVVVHYARRADTGEDILGQLDAYREALEGALFEAAEADAQPRRSYSRTALLVAEVAR